MLDDQLVERGVIAVQVDGGGQDGGAALQPHAVQLGAVEPCRRGIRGAEVQANADAFQDFPRLPAPPASAAEIGAARSLLDKAGLLGPTTRFALLALEEPAKEPR